VAFKERFILERAVFKSDRYLDVDAVRGMLIVIMALDHANYFVAQQHSLGEYWGGPYPTYSGSIAFLTRLITHLAAPGFFLLMGVGMILFAKSRQRRGWNRWSVVRHFWVRGAILIIIQLLIVNRAWELSPGGWGMQYYIGVLFALGGTMILASMLLWLDSRLLIAITLLLFVGTELTHPDPNQWNLINQTPITLLFVYPGGDQALWSNYPIVPWLELVTFGLVFGSWLADDSDRAYRRGLILGGVFLLLFVLIRYLDGFGNIRPRAGASWIDFFNLVKYPPSMVFTFLTTGINLVLLWLFCRISMGKAAILEPLAIFGRTPLFFYLLHLFLYAALGRLLAPNGSSILKMYPTWVLGLIILFPLCIGYANVRQRRSLTHILRYL
jgi:uncharacterized membrane protein